MKKNSKQGKKENKPAVFTNAPFKSLKGLRPSASAPVAARPEPPVPPDPDAGDEAALFLRAVRGARPVAPDKGEAEVPAAGPRPAPAGQPGREEGNERELFLQAMGRLGSAPGKEDDLGAAGGGDVPARSLSSRMRQLKRGTIRISGELDLHGFLKDEALHRLEHFIDSAVARGLQAVLVITGKGTNSPEGPVLPGAVDAWFRERGKGKVAEFHLAPRDKGGSGAFVVFLKER